MSQWADEYRRLSSESSAEPGHWRTDRAPFQKEIMDEISNPLVDRVTVMASAQVGKTEIINNTIGYFADFDPSPMLLIQPTLGLAESYSKDRLAPMIRDSPSLFKCFGGEKAKKSNNTLLHKQFFGGQITLAGANSPASLASRPIRILLLDEIDRYTTSAGDEGDPVNLAMKRTTTFHNKKIIGVSTPLIKKQSRIEALFEEGDKRRFHIECPHCKEYIVLKFSRLKMVEEKKTETTVYLCQECDAIIDESLKYPLLKNGKWIAEKPFNGHASFHLNEMYSPWKKWAQIMADFLEAKKNPESLKVFVNTSLGESWEVKGEAPEWRRLYDRRENYEIGIVPKNAYFLTGAADIQKDRIELEIRAWGKNKESWSIDYQILMGDTAKEEVWQGLEKVINTFFETESGELMPITKFAVDSGYNTQKVYDFVRKFNSQKVVAVKGQEALEQIVASPKSVDITRDGKTSRRGLKIFHVGTNIIKSEFYGYLKLNNPTTEELILSNGKYPFGFIHFPEYGEEYFKQLTSEALVTKTLKGYIKYEWVKTYERNESLDCAVYNRAAAALIGIDRFKESHFEQLLSSTLTKKVNIEENKNDQNQNPEIKTTTKKNSSIKFKKSFYEY